jgi:DNA repair protein RadC
MLHLARLPMTLEDLSPLPRRTMLLACAGDERPLHELVRKVLDLTDSEARRLGEGDALAARCLHLSRFGAAHIAHATGMSESKGERLAMVFEIGRRLEEICWAAHDCVRTPGGVYRFLAPKMRGLERETLFVLSLDGRHRMTACQRVSEGTLTMSLVHPREIFGVAIRERAAAIIVAHNHPSGDSEPSAEDFEVTRRLSEAGKLMGIPLLDHVVVGHGEHTSLRERMDL